MHINPGGRVEDGAEGAAGGVRMGGAEDEGKKGCASRDGGENADARGEAIVCDEVLEGDGVDETACRV